MSLPRIGIKLNYFAQVIASGVIAGGSDLFCQKVIEREPNIDWKRTARFGSVICFFVAPVSYQWFRIVDRVFAKRGNTWQSVIKRTAVDQIFAAPVMTSWLLVCLSTLETRSVPVAVSKTALVLPNVMVMNWKIWPLVQLLNFTFIPLRYRVVFVQSIGAIWNVYLSHMQREAVHAL